MRRLERARRLHWGRCHDSIETQYSCPLYWDDEFRGETSDWRHRVAASLALDGYPARWPRICWKCDKGWGHNAGGKKLGHAPTKHPSDWHAP